MTDATRYQVNVAFRAMLQRMGWARTPAYPLAHELGTIRLEFIPDHGYVLEQTRNRRGEVRILGAWDTKEQTIAALNSMEGTNGTSQTLE